VQTFPNFYAAFTTIVGLIVFGTAFFLPPFHWLLEKYVLPKPGEGPSDKEMDSKFLKVDGYGKGKSGKQLKTMMYFPTDPGYRDTVRNRRLDRLEMFLLIVFSFLRREC
jgi:short subunit dehydrogenase-like uncharacterized protein